METDSVGKKCYQAETHLCGGQGIVFSLWSCFSIENHHGYRGETKPNWYVSQIN